MTKHALILAVSLFALGCNKMEFEPIPEAEVNASHRTSAETLGKQILTEWGKDEYKPLGSEANDEFKKAHNSVDGQRTSDKSIEKAFGSFQSMALAQSLRTKDKKAEVYRFKAVFDKTSDPVEVRVVLDDQGKLSGFWIKGWKESI